MTHDDGWFRFRLRLFARAAELGNVRAACRILGVHPSTHHRWRKPARRQGLDALRPRERRPRWGGHRRSPHRIWNVWCRARRNTRA